jgi:hypothetical protein
VSQLHLLTLKILDGRWRALSNRATTPPRRLVGARFSLARPGPVTDLKQSGFRSLLRRPLLLSEEQGLSELTPSVGHANYRKSNSSAKAVPQQDFRTREHLTVAGRGPRRVLTTTLGDIRHHRLLVGRRPRRRPLAGMIQRRSTAF